MFALTARKALQFCGTEQHLIDTESDINYLDVCLFRVVRRRRRRRCFLSHVPKLSSEDESGRAFCGILATADVATANLRATIERRQTDSRQLLWLFFLRLVETYFSAEEDEDVKITRLSTGKTDEPFRSQLAVSKSASNRIHL